MNSFLKYFFSLFLYLASNCAVGQQERIQYDFEKNPTKYFQKGKEFIYTVEISKSSEKFEYELGYGLVAEGKATNRVDSIGIYVIGEEVYEQISIEFKRYVQGSYYKNQRISTGVIENDSLIWVHPYRADWFKILNLSPYPQYSPFWKNGEFRDSLTVGGRYIEDTKVAAGKSIVVRSFYTSYVKDGIVTVKSKSISEAGESFLEVTFDPSIGITKMKYQTISNHEVVFRLVNVKHQED